ncbi:MAG: TM2 domain-containing protein [Colwellia sp.]|nr:TM2 domain-containing protein [Colwellia sp.]MCW8866043.1 TM2 domain-containing protein [Colwellia sp.]MCW9081257.1 TM2 domain-containing protein [Colwellia sp.]
MNNEDLQQEENQLREQVASLSVAQKRQYYAQELQHIKDPDTYAALNWAFVAGLHHFYLGKWQRGLLNLFLMFIGVMLYFSSAFSLLGLALVLAVFIIELPQLLNSQNIIYHYNNQLMRRLLQQFNN